MSKKYNNYLRSDHWKDTRQEALKRAKGKCSHCKTRLFLEVHHKTYSNIGHERPEDLQVLCRFCHQEVHDRQAKKGDELVPLAWTCVVVVWLALVVLCQLCGSPFFYLF